MARTTTYTTSGGRFVCWAGRRTHGRFAAGARCGAGLTLVEVLVVVGIIVLLAGLVVGLTRHVDNQAKEKALANTFALLKSALREYYDFNDVFPTPNGSDPASRAASLYTDLARVPASRQALAQISPAFARCGVAPPDSKVKVYDPWGTVIDYRYNMGDSFPLMISAGPDKTFGTADDIDSKHV